MEAFNLTASNLSTFILNGIPGLEDAHIWISIPFTMFYIISLLGNFTVLFIVFKEQTLHKPMFLLICMLAVTDVGQCTCIVPKALCIFWFHSKVITVDGCFTQILFLYVLVAMQSAILLSMAFDRYVAICDPLRYTIIFTNARVAKLGLASLIRAVLLILPMILLLQRLPFCANRVIPHTYCEHLTVVKISCGDTTVNRTYSLVALLVTVGSDLILASLSYGMIIRSVLRVSSKKANQKALNTCTAHVCVLLMACAPLIFSSLTRRFGQGIAPHTDILLANLYIIVPAMLNPIIYGVKTKELRDKLRIYTSRM